MWPPERDIASKMTRKIIQISSVKIKVFPRPLRADMVTSHRAPLLARPSCANPEVNNERRNSEQARAAARGVVPNVPLVGWVCDARGQRSLSHFPRGSRSNSLGAHVGCVLQRKTWTTPASAQSKAPMSRETPQEGDGAQCSSQALSTLSPSQAQSKSQGSSSSSSGPASGSQSSSGSGTLSSADTLPVTLPSVPEEPESQPWGRLLPMQPGFGSHDCVEDEYLFGRDSKCHYVLDDPDHRGSLRFRIYSKRHFRIYREGTEVFVQDLSNNGTFVDGNKIGSNKILPLVNNAVLALSEQRNKVFVFIDLMSGQESTLPKELRDKYLLTRRIGTGVCGEVKLAFQRSTCKKFAVKVINKNNFKSEGTAARNAQTEIEILQRIDHPCLIRTEDFYQTDDTFFIVLELRAVPAQPGHHPPGPETGEHPPVVAGRRLPRQGDGLQPVTHPRGGGPDADAVRDAVLPGARGADARRHRRIRPARRRLEPRRPPVCLPVRVPAVPRELLGPVGERADRARPLHHGAVQVAPGVRPG
ncbi:serine/threonine-protein kinase Chk2 isoform X5 [Syngnathus acus]|uniref:serine/threonine-protein kinase Chk2 isoform X5 n=1 Tax=Syngnathus acus TaxID=161584 RepID=UPI00188617AE|nr:serine/threonine-protein kinase Chk2 isoform X5 [Syngnathus acus]